jgi:hypothetical protein
MFDWCLHWLEQWWISERDARMANATANDGHKH